MREREQKKIIGKMNEVSKETFGKTLYFRPFAEDDEIINQIIRQTGEKKSSVAQKLLHLAINGKRFDFDVDKRQLSKLDWLVNCEKHRAVKDDVRDALVERLEEHAREMESRVTEIAENARFTKTLASEIYCVAVVCMSLSNQIFTKIIEYFSPVEIEKKNSTDFANRNALGLIEHALAELENLEAHHDADSEITQTEMLYLFTKIEKIRQRLLPMSAEQITVKNNR
jgi:hypothetical protein